MLFGNVDFCHAHDNNRFPEILWSKMKTCSGGLVLFGCDIKNSLIGAQVLVGAHLSFQSHQFIYNVLEYIYADGISAFWWFLSLKTGMEINKISCIDIYIYL